MELKKENEDKTLESKTFNLNNEININNNIDKTLTSNIDLTKANEKYIEELFSYKDIKNFNPDDLYRKYNKNNFDIGKKFFKYRYIKKKLEEIGPKLGARNSVFIIKDLENIKNKKKDKRLSYSINLIFNENINRNEKIFNDKNDFRNFESNFLTIVEKSIIHFNFKKYNESYKVLFQEKIINSEEEFGEFLLVVNGYDKNVLGTFLAKDKPPNENKKVINGFMNRIDLKYVKQEDNTNNNINNNYFLDCLRFLLSRLNLPQDANLILQIMDTYSTFLFNSNKDDQEFIKKYSSIDAIYLLISTLLALNTMFTRKDIKNMNIIKKEQFLEMNKDIDKNEAISIYDNLEKNPISMSYNYNDIIYQKMSLLVKENDNTRSYRKSITKSMKNVTQFKSIENMENKIIEEKDENQIEEDINDYLKINIQKENENENDDENGIDNININNLMIDNNDNNKNDEAKIIKNFKKFNTSIYNSYNIKKHFSTDGFNQYENLRQISFSYWENLYSFTDKDKSILIKPIKFLKLINKNSNHIRAFVVDDKLEKLIWAKEIEIITNPDNTTKSMKTKGNVHNLLINDIENVHNGIEKSKLISDYVRLYPKEEKEANYFISIETSNKSFCIKAETQEIALSWFKALKSLVIKNKNANPKSKINKDIISKIKYKAKEIWYTLISPYWNIYGNYLHYKVQNKVDYQKQINKKDNNIYTKNGLILEEKPTFTLDERKRFVYEAEMKIVYDNFFDYNEFLYLFNFGLPSKIRGNIWSILIGNPCGINISLYKSYKKLIKSIDFEKLIKEYEKNKNIDITLSEIKEDINNDKYLISQILLDILNIKDKYLIKYTVSPYKIISVVYSIARVFFLMRPDIKYNKSLIAFSFIFILVYKDEYKSFCNMFNLICSTNTLQYYLKNEDYIDSRIKFFDNLLSSRIPKISLHFKNLDISSELFLVYWFENIFSFTFDYHLLRRIFDLYLLHGECILFQVALTIIKIQEDELLNFTISDIFKNLKKLPKEYKEENFIELMYLNNIYSDYQLWKTSRDIENQMNKLSAVIEDE